MPAKMWVSGFEPAHRRFFTVGQSLSLADWPGRPPVTGHPTTRFIRAATPMWPNARSGSRTRRTRPFPSALPPPSSLASTLGVGYGGWRTPVALSAAAVA